MTRPGGRDELRLADRHSGRRLAHSAKALAQVQPRQTISLCRLRVTLRGLPGRVQFGPVVNWRDDLLDGHVSEKEKRSG